MADDEPELRRILARALRGHGYDVVTAANGREATEAWSRQTPPFDLAILDVRMPVMNGYEAYLQIRTISPGARFLFVSGYAGDALWRTLQAEADVRCMLKPFGATELVAAVRALLAA